VKLDLVCASCGANLTVEDTAWFGIGDSTWKLYVEPHTCEARAVGRAATQQET